MNMPIFHGAFILRFLHANSWNSLTVCVLTVHTRHNLQTNSLESDYLEKNYSLL